MVLAWFGLYFASAKHSLAAHKVMLVVPNLAQEHHVHHMDPYTNYIGRTWSHTQSHLRYLTSHILHDVSFSIIEVMRIDHAYNGVPIHHINYLWSNCVTAGLISFHPVTLHAFSASLLTTIILYIVCDCLFTSM